MALKQRGELCRLGGELLDRGGVVRRCLTFPDRKKLKERD
ncbi:hypothetical protein MES5069_550096 [Mesorhizobium escarrei]|uniref:Uncharacterized protein n=1 Tax=Mesorhizobium escarrei TaxID=666018 RepID=A0ABM9ECK1_9HYPH|nr:hypothetical protein MES5069_550096 [Mesorhizobium escarrei]